MRRDEPTVILKSKQLVDLPIFVCVLDYVVVRSGYVVICEVDRHGRQERATYMETMGEKRHSVRLNNEVMMDAIE